VQDFIEELVGELGHGHPLDQAARVVDQDVDAAEGLQHIRDGLPDGRAVPHVGLDQQGFATRLRTASATSLAGPCDWL
jgi:hypothetical protein